MNGNEQLLNFLANNPHAPLAQEVFSEAKLEEFSATRKAMRVGAAIGGGLAAGAGVLAGQHKYLSNIRPEQKSWFNTGREWASGALDSGTASAKTVGYGIRDAANKVAEWASSNNATIGGHMNGAIVGAGTAAAGMALAGAGIARNRYLSKRRRQAGVSTNAALREVNVARRAEKKALKKIAGMNRAKLKSRLVKKYGFSDVE
jgi:hypothetical protein